jgi:cysteine synthase A
MVCAQKGYPLVVTMAENFSVERRKMMRFLGAKVVLTPAARRAAVCSRRRSSSPQTHGWFLCRQFENEANADMHSRTTAPEILADFAGDRLDYFVTATARAARSRASRACCASDPRRRSWCASPTTCRSCRAGSRSRATPAVPTSSHPSFRPHVMQGWTPDFIPKLTRTRSTMKLVDRILPVNGADAMRCSRDLAQQEGIFVGITAGATLAGALRVCERRRRRERAVHAARHCRALSLDAAVRGRSRRDDRRRARDRAVDANYRFDVSARPRADGGRARAAAVEADAAAFVAQVIGDRGSRW